MAIELCGNRQLGNGIKGGVEILVHSIRLLLELNPEWVILKTDIKNAFNEISRNAIINTVNKSANELLHYTNSFLNNDNNIFFNDIKNKLCLKIEQTKFGSPQGAPASFPLYCITQAPIIKEMEVEHSDIIILSFCDDNTFIGSFHNVTEAFPTFKQKAARINLQIQDSKTSIYSKTTFTQEEIDKCDQLQINIIPHNEGIEIAGAPIGSDNFINNFLSNKVNEIEDQLKLYMDASTRLYTSKNHDSQTLFMIARLCISSQFTYLLRVCDPIYTKPIAIRLDNLIYDFICQIIEANPIIELLQEHKKYLTRDLLFLPIKHGGCGLISSEFIAEAAFMGSISLSAHWIGKIIPSLIITEDNLETIFLPTTMNSFKNLLLTYKAKMNTDIEHVSLLSIWEGSIPSIQRIITQNLYEEKKKI